MRYRQTLVEPTDPVVVDCKRMHLPYVLSAKCECGERVQVNLFNDHHVASPTLHVQGSTKNMRTPVKVYFYCQTCEREWQSRYTVFVSIEEVPQ